MLTAMRLTKKTTCAQTQMLIAQYLQRSNVTVCVAQKQRNTQKHLRSRHIGKNCVARSNARV